jgi:hypothetical protein
VHAVATAIAILSGLRVVDNRASHSRLAVGFENAPENGGDLDMSMERIKNIKGKGVKK